MTTHVMIDIETLGTTPDAVILSIGGVKFDPNGDRIFDDFSYKLDIDEQQQRGRVTSEDTMSWWAKQPREVIESAFGLEERTPVDEMLDHLKRWCVGADAFWAQGPTFDMCMLENLYRQYNKPYPWAFWKVRDSRTLFSLMPTDPRKAMKFAAHDALEDCKAQAKCVQHSLRHLGVKIK